MPFFRDKLFKPSYYRLIFLVLRTYAGNKKRGTFRWKGAAFKHNDLRALTGMFNEIIHLEHYKINAVQPNPLIIDCGANIGISVLYFAKTVPNVRIVAVEADPEIFSILQGNCTQNNIPATLINKAVWTSDDAVLKFGMAGADAGSLKSTQNTIDVKTIRLKTLLQDSGAVELLKIDIEGSEVAVMEDCKDVLGQVDKIFVEYHSFPGETQELDVLLRILTNAGFRYLVLPARKMKSPFVNRFQDEVMDLQLNIFAFRTS